MTKILATIGPATEKISNIKKILNITNLVRLNGAHNTIGWHEKISKLLDRCPISNKNICNAYKSIYL